MDINNEWVQKYLREAWSFPFGSMCNAYGQVNQGNKIKTMTDFIIEMEEIYALAQKLIKKSVEPEEIKKVKEFLKKVETESTYGKKTLEEGFNETSERGDALPLL